MWIGLIFVGLFVAVVFMMLGHPMTSATPDISRAHEELPKIAR
jgi:hypothetical protein